MDCKLRREEMRIRESWEFGGKGKENSVKTVEDVMKTSASTLDLLHVLVAVLKKPPA